MERWHAMALGRFDSADSIAKGTLASISGPARFAARKRSAGNVLANAETDGGSITGIGTVTFEAVPVEMEYPTARIGTR